MDNVERTKAAYKVSINTIIANVLLSALKLFIGFTAKSSALISDSVHSLSDVLSTFVVMVGIKIAEKEEDEDHPYGHEKFEAIAGTLLAVLLFATAVGIGLDGIKKINEALNGELSKPGYLAIIAAIISIVTKEAMFWYTKKVAKKIDSPALLADAWHHRSDALSSIGSLLGIGGAILGFTVLDPAASIAIGLFIIKVAYDIFMQSVAQTVDTAASKELTKEIKEKILGTKGVLAVDMLKTRIHANRIYIDTEIAVEKTMTLIHAHEIAEDVHLTLEKTFPQVKHCMVHVNPYME